MTREKFLEARRMKQSQRTVMTGADILHHSWRNQRGKVATGDGLTGENGKN